MPDYLVADHGTIALIRPLNDAAQEYLREITPADAPWFGRALACEPRYVEPILVDLIDNNFTVRPA